MHILELVMAFVSRRTSVIYRAFCHAVDSKPRKGPNR